ncbi:MAG: DNA-binding protein Alba [Candidatus Methanomethyliaceae archaeon]|nr:DNA-binding protein Alba [Candidatus Methanomethyliaceae archaeon]
MLPQEIAILVGKKPPMNYVLACLTSFHEGAVEIVIKARGQSISKAVDIAEIVKNKFMPNSFIKEVTIDTEEIPLREGGGTKRASSIMIRLSKST